MDSISNGNEDHLKSVLINLNETGGMQGLYYKSEISHRTRKQLTAYVLKIVTKTNNLMLGR